MTASSQRPLIEPFPHAITLTLFFSPPSLIMPTDYLLTPCDNSWETPLTTADFSWFTNGSCLKDENHAGYAIATLFEVTEVAPLSSATLAQ